MGAAIAAALAAPAPLTMLVFVAMGFGLAAPYALLALAPGLARLLPRPGRWMDVLRGALAFPMYGAAVWLLWVVSLEAGEAGVLTVAGGALLLALGAWALGLAQRSGGRFRGFGRSVAHRGRRRRGRRPCCAAALRRSARSPRDRGRRGIHARAAWPRCAPRAARFSST